MEMGRGRPADRKIAQRGDSLMGGWFTSGCEEEPDEDWFSPDMTDTQIRVDNHHLNEVSHVPEKTILT